MYKEALGFYIEYFKLYTHTKNRVWNEDEESGDCGKVLMGSAKDKILSLEEHQVIHS